MSFYKIIAAFTIVLSIFSSNVFSMDNDESLLSSDKPNYSSLSVPIKQNIDREEKRCSHWGLSRWMAGIGEYLQVCCGGKVDKKDGFYKKHYNKPFSTSPEVYELSDCNFNYHQYSREYGCCGPSCIKAFFCCPVATALHLCCLPCACCSPSKGNPEYVDCKHSTSAYYSPPQTSEERAAANASMASSALEHKHRFCTHRTCVYGGYSGYSAECTKRN